MANFTFLYFVEPNYYKEALLGFTNTILGYCNKIVYISLNRTYKNVKRVIAEKGLDAGKFYFVDGISKAFFPDEASKEAVLLSFPLDLKELERVISGFVNNNEVDGLIFDSVTNLTIYEKQDEVLKFFGRLTAQLGDKMVISLFVASTKDKHSKLCEYLATCVDSTKEIVDEVK